MGIKVLSLFDGISGAYEALKLCNIPIDKYYSSEIDKHAIAISKYNHPYIIQIGDVTKVNGYDYKDIDLLIGGSPCTNLSICGDRTGLDGIESKLFYEYVRLKNEINPKYFFLENVASMTNENKDKMSKIIGCDCVKINSALLSAQNRERYYWTNINMGDIDQPKDLNVFLKDIIIDGIADRYKSYCVDASYAKGGNYESYMKKGRRQIVIKEDNPICIAMRGRKNEEGKYIQEIEPNVMGKSNTLTSVGKDNMILLGNLYKSGGQAGRVYDINGKGTSLTALRGGGGAKTGLYFIPPFNFKMQRTEEAKLKRKELKKETGVDHSSFADKDLVPKLDGKSNTLMTNMGVEHLLFTGIKEEESNELNEIFKTYFPEISNEEILNLIKNNIRMLYPIEAERLQSFSDEYTKYGINENGIKYEVSKSQRYKCLGNSFTVNVIAYILSHNKEWCEKVIFESNPIKQLKLF